MLTQLITVTSSMPLAHDCQFMSCKPTLLRTDNHLPPSQVGSPAHWTTCWVWAAFTRSHRRYPFWQTRYLWIYFKHTGESEYEGNEGLEVGYGTAEGERAANYLYLPSPCPMSDHYGTKLRSFPHSWGSTRTTGKPVFSVLHGHGSLGCSRFSSGWF